jgi:branched-chain amino acid transport system permease protein
MLTQASYYLLFVMAFILLVWSAYIPFRAGLLYNGTVYCMCLGGYFSAWLVKDVGLPFGVAVVIAMLIGTALGFLPALSFSRTSGIVTAVASMALIFIIQSIVQNVAFLGGANGMLGIPKASGLLPFSIICTVVVGVLIFRFDHSRLGRAFEAIGTDWDFAASLGINVRKHLILALTLSSVLASLSGVIYAFNIRVIRPDTFGFTLLLFTMTMLFVGGRFTHFGALISVPILWGLSSWIPSEYARFTQIIYGTLLIVVLMARPEGLITRATIHRIVRVFRRRVT